MIPGVFKFIPSALVYTELHHVHNCKKGIAPIVTSDDCEVMLPVASPVSMHTSRTSMEVFSLEKAVEICLNALCADGTAYFFCWFFDLFDLRQKKEGKKHQNKQKAKLFKIPFTIKIQRYA